MLIRQRTLGLTPSEDSVEGIGGAEKESSSHFLESHPPPPAELLSHNAHQESGYLAELANREARMCGSQSVRQECR